MSTSDLSSLSLAIGWVYTVLWTVSFWPQVYLNYKRQSTAGLSYDHLCLNMIGYSAYSLYTGVSYFTHQPGGAELNDFFFALHGLVVILFQIVQCYYYERNYQTVATATRVFVSFCVFSAIVLGLAAHFHLSALGFSPTMSFWLQWLGETKVCITLIKYVPQVLLNRKTHSTAGWALWGVLTDFVGGIFSIGQMVLQAIACGQSSRCGAGCICPASPPSGSSGSSLMSGFMRANMPKLGLGLVSIGFDAIFMTQHFCLFGPRRVGGINFALSVRRDVEEGSGTVAGELEDVLLEK